MDVSASLSGFHHKSGKFFNNLNGSKSGVDVIFPFNCRVNEGLGDGGFRSRTDGGTENSGEGRDLGGNSRIGSGRDNVRLVPRREILWLTVRLWS